MKKIDTYKIVALRKHYQLKQDDVAKALNIGRVTYITREKHGSFTDDELNKLSDLLNVERSELVIQEGSFTGDQIHKISDFLNEHLPEPFNKMLLSNPSFKSALYSEQETEKLKSAKSFWDKFNVNLKLEDFLPEPDEPKPGLPEEVKKTTYEQTRSSNGSESVYQSKYISLLEDQLREKEEMIKELRETLLRLEGQMKHMFDKINHQNKQLSEFSQAIRSELNESRNFSTRTFELFMKKQKRSDKG